MSKALIDHIVSVGRKESWDALALRFGLASGEAARSIWRRYNQQKVGFEFQQYQIEQSAYINELEDTVQKLAKQNSSPSARVVRHFNPGPNPLDYSLELQKETIITEIKRNSPVANSIFEPKPINTIANNMLELAVFDLHIGKLAWSEETGEDYDMQIAIKRYKDAIRELISRVDMDTIDRILLPIGNDMINVDSKSNMTTSGTPQSCDSRFAKMFRAAKTLMIDTITELSSLKIVDVVIIPGNHDEVSMFTLGEVLDAWFHNNQNVKVYNSPNLRKYYAYGSCMIMFTHGDKEKHSDLGMIAATEQPSMWACTKYREVHLGHLHKSKSMSYLGVDEYQGFKVRILPSLSGTDAWHASKGYISQKSAQAFVWNKDKGLISNHFYNV